MERSQGRPVLVVCLAGSARRSKKERLELNIDRLQLLFVLYCNLQSQWREIGRPEGAATASLFGFKSDKLQSSFVPHHVSIRDSRPKPLEESQCPALSALSLPSHFEFKLLLILMGRAASPPQSDRHLFLTLLKSLSFHQ